MLWSLLLARAVAGTQLLPVADQLHSCLTHLTCVSSAYENTFMNIPLHPHLSYTKESTLSLWFRPLFLDEQNTLETSVHRDPRS